MGTGQSQLWDQKNVSCLGSLMHAMILSYNSFLNGHDTVESKVTDFFAIFLEKRSEYEDPLHSYMVETSESCCNSDDSF